MVVAVLSLRMRGLAVLWSGGLAARRGCGVEGVAVESDGQAVALGGGLGGRSRSAGPGRPGAWRTNTEVSPAWTQATGQPSAVSVDGDLDVAGGDHRPPGPGQDQRDVGERARRRGLAVVSSAWMSFSAAVSV